MMVRAIIVGRFTANANYPTRAETKEYINH